MANGNLFGGFVAGNQARTDALGGAVNALAQGWQDQRDKQAVEARQQRALGYLVKASELSGQDDAASEQMFMQAYQEDPEFTTQLLQAQKARRDSMSAGQGKPLTEYQRESLRLREMEAALKQEDNDLRREQLQLNVDTQRAKLEALEQKTSSEARDIEQSERNVEIERQNTADLVTRMLSHSGLGAAVGRSSALPTIPGGAAADFEAMFNTLKGKQFLNAVQQMRGSGSLSDAEGKKIAAAAESLELSMSEEAFKDALRRIRDGLRTAKSPGTFSTESEETKTISWDDL